MKNRFYLFLLLFLPACFIACKKNDAPSPTPVTQNDIAAIDSRASTFLTTYNAPGASIAITKNGKLVYRKGYGKADVAANEAVTVNHKFRVASVSKVLTATAIMKLVEEGKLNLDDKVFGTGAVLGTTYGTGANYSANVKSITVRNMLQHTAGWRNVWPGDPAYQQPTYSHAQLIGYVLDNVPVAVAPGTQYQYSNFCFIVLARIIEKVSGKTYEQYIQQNIMNPLGANNTQIAGITEAERKTNEVKYYGQGAEAAYVYTDPWTRMDGAGGIITTPTDLIRLLCAIDSFSTRPDILNVNTLKTMTTPVLSGTSNGCGLFVENDATLGMQWYHFGSLPGCQSVVLRTSKGYNIAFVTNTRYTNGATSLNAIAKLVSDILADNSITWQDIDQF